MSLHQAASNQVTFQSLISCLFKTGYIVSFELFHIYIRFVFDLRRRHFLIAKNTAQHLNNTCPLGFKQVSKRMVQTKSSPLTTLL